jgi:putative transcriptional regulator
MIKSLKTGLKSRDFEVAELWGMGFDLVAKKDETYLIKSSENINSIKAGVASRLKRIAGFLRSFAMVVGEKRGNQPLHNRVVYHRYGIPALNQRTFYDVLDGDFPERRSEKRGIIAEIDQSRLGEIDVEKVAKRLGVSRRCVFYYMSGDVGAIKQDKMEIFKEEFGDVFKPYELKKFEIESDSSSYKFAQRLEEMGFENAAVNTRVCDLLSRMQELGIVSKVGNSEWSLRYHAGSIKHVSEALEMKPLFILRTRKKMKKEVKGVPAVSTKTISESDSEEFLEIVEA